MSGQVVHTPTLYGPWERLDTATQLAREQTAPWTHSGGFRPDPTRADFGMHAYNAALEQAEFEQMQRNRKAALAQLTSWAGPPGATQTDTAESADQWARQYAAPGEVPDAPAYSIRPKTNTSGAVRPGHQTPIEPPNPRDARL